MWPWTHPEEWFLKCFYIYVMFIVLLLKTYVFLCREAGLSQSLLLFRTMSLFLLFGRLSCGCDSNFGVTIVAWTWPGNSLLYDCWIQTSQDNFHLLLQKWIVMKSSSNFSVTVTGALKILLWQCSSSLTITIVTISLSGCDAISCSTVWAFCWGATSLWKWDVIVSLVLPIY